MKFEELLYSIGSLVEKMGAKMKDFIIPSPSEKIPKSKFLKRNLTPHELISLRLQLSFLLFLVISLISMLLRNLPILILAFTLEFLYIRYTLIKNREFMVSFNPYRFFYYGISTMTFLAFLGYLILRNFTKALKYYLVYIGIISLAVLGFRYYFKHRFGRDYTYGIVEEIKNDLAKVFVHDDISANVKPGYYWVPANANIKEGDIVKLLVEQRTFRGSIPVRILEVSQSSQTSTEPKDESE
ncbi:DUF2101 family protein [Pyrococcus abyssi]|uniref:DUF2101 domain-containing protein n=1 Tax=Pyrococcus abyssi (strain GE5 / Orsay) TaxID=272844 RepID=Q9V0I3_PYRAB|nr:DUF2101 family protein [Pyrococcus abyssi]CAB49720.1 Hypothetical protein PAB2392 [Pyrococcus abyssi GE5]CCE70207.1 TPA: hypothetical protein PAB2392 [Pyrococcus abyssi GE5]